MTPQCSYLNNLIAHLQVNYQRCIYTFGQSRRPNTWKYLANTKAECWNLFKFLSICRFNLTFADPFLTKPHKRFNGQHNHFFLSSKTPPLIKKRIKVLEKRGGELKNLKILRFSCGFIKNRLASFKPICF